MTVSEYKDNLKSQPMPTYSPGEELFNWISHGLGVVIGFVVLGYVIAFSILESYDPWQIVALIFYACSIIVLYATSTIYHALPKGATIKKFFRLLDHNTIYILIAGTYAPIGAFAFGGTSYGLIIMSIEILGLLVGTALNIFNLNGKVTQVITVVLYVAMGWLIVIFYPAISMMPLPSMILILLGGISYTLGVIFYAIGRKIKWMHSIFHLFVLTGTILQLIGVFLLILT